MRAMHKPDTFGQRVLHFLGLEWNPQPMLAPYKINVLAALTFVVGIIVLILIPTFWPAIILVIGVALTLRKALFRRRYAALLSAVTFGGLYYALWQDPVWKTEAIVLLTVGAMTLLFRELLHLRRPLPLEELEQLNMELKDERWE